MIKHQIQSTLLCRLTMIQRELATLKILYSSIRKSMFQNQAELSAAGGYKGYANGEDVTNALMVDGNNKTTDVVHYMMTKPIVQQITDDYLKNKSNAANGMMTFSLVPSKNGSMAMGGNAMNNTMMMMPPGAK